VQGYQTHRHWCVHPCSTDALLGATEASAARLIHAVLFGPEATIRKLAVATKVEFGKIVASADPEEPAAAASAGELHAMMKGSSHTDQFMHAVVAKESNLRIDRLLRQCMLVAAPTYARRIIISDAAVNSAPTIDQKKDIIQNAIILARSIGRAAAALAKMADRRQIAGGIVDGPLDLDIAGTRSPPASKVSSRR